MQLYIYTVPIRSISAQFGEQVDQRRQRIRDLFGGRRLPAPDLLKHGGAPSVSSAPFSSPSSSTSWLLPPCHDRLDALCNHSIQTKSIY